jgi:hypothetical protein
MMGAALDAGSGDFVDDIVAVFLSRRLAAAVVSNKKTRTAVDSRGRASR